jgi:hypothetical protein
MATDTATTQTETKPADSAKKATPRRKPASRAKAKSTTRSRSTRSASKSRKPAAARTTRSEPTATATASTPATDTPRPEAKALNGGQQFVAGVIDAQEKTVQAIADYQTRAAALSQIPGASAVAEAQAQVLRSVTGAYVSAARAFLK